MSQPALFPVLKIHGSPADRGQALGTELRDRIAAAWKTYRGYFSTWKESDLIATTEKIFSHIERAFPIYGVEIKEIAKSSGLPLWQIVALNSRTELLHEPYRVHECTAIFSRPRRILAENWDFAQALEALTVIVRMDLGTHQIITMAEPGMLAKVGMNSYGVGVCLNRLGCQEDIDGVPVHILLRAVLDCRSVDEAVAMLQRVQVGSESNLMIGDASGAGINAEIAGSTLGIYGADECNLIHANHYVYLKNSEASTPEDVLHSTTRHNRAVELAQLKPELSFEDVAKLLRDQNHPLYPICRPYIDDSVLLGCTGTVSTLIMELPERRFHYTPGTPLENGFRWESLAPLRT